MTAVTISERDLEQKLTALGSANGVRSTRAAIKAMLHAECRAGASTAATLLQNPPEVLLTVDIGDFLQWVWRLGKQEAKKMLMYRQTSPWREVGELTDRQRRLLAGDLEGYAAGRTKIPSRSARERAHRERVNRELANRFREW